LALLVQKGQEDTGPSVIISTSSKAIMDDCSYSFWQFFSDAEVCFGIIFSLDNQLSEE